MVILILHNSPPPQIPVIPDSAQHAEEKIRDFQSSASQSSGQKLEMDQSELNGWLIENLALNGSQISVHTPFSQTPESLISLAKTATGAKTPDDTSQEQANSSLRDI